MCRSFGMTHEQLTELAAREPAGCEGVNFLPYLTGERTPSWPHARGALLGLGPGCVEATCNDCPPDWDTHQGKPMQLKHDQVAGVCTGIMKAWQIGVH